MRSLHIEISAEPRMIQYRKACMLKCHRLIIPVSGEVFNVWHAFDIHDRKKDILRREFI